MLSISKPVIDSHTKDSVEKVLSSGRLSQGKIVREFEEAFAAYIGTHYAITTSSGTAAIELALHAHGIGAGDEVITTPFSFISTSNAIKNCNAIPVFVDVASASLTIDPSKIEARITPKTKALLGVHLYGQTFDVRRILEICARNGIIMIEDACQAHGAEFFGGKAGSFGTGCFSFYPTKNMTTGEGGMITTSDEIIAQRCRSIANHGQGQPKQMSVPGHNFRMDEIRAAIGLAQLKRLDEFNQKRINNAHILNMAVHNIRGLVAPRQFPGRKHVYNQFTMQVKKEYKLTRDELKSHLENRDIGTAIYYPQPIHHQDYYKNLGYRDSFPVAEQAAKEVISLPVHPSLTPDDMKKIVKALRDA